MKSTLLSFVLFFSVVSPTAAIAQSDRNSVWQAARCKGLIIGRSKRRDMLRVFGKPVRQYEPEGSKGEEVWYDYDRGGEFEGKMTVAVDNRTQTIIEIVLYPSNLTRKEVTERFGQSFVSTWYRSCPNIDSDSGPIYESAGGGSLYYVEYRALGIAISFGAYNQVHEILYVSRPLGFKSVKGCEKERTAEERRSRR